MSKISTISFSHSEFIVENKSKSVFCWVFLFNVYQVHWTRHKIWRNFWWQLQFSFFFIKIVKFLNIIFVKWFFSLYVVSSNVFCVRNVSQYGNNSIFKCKHSIDLINMVRATNYSDFTWICGNYSGYITRIFNSLTSIRLTLSRYSQLANDDLIKNHSIWY